MALYAYVSSDEDDLDGDDFIVTRELEDIPSSEGDLDDLDDPDPVREEPPVRGRCNWNPSGDKEGTQTPPTSRGDSQAYLLQVE
ncbi:hypothetical protein Pcinc_004323 [Petrolisthes cinctipes]|uniref:Uncharacterized protein n=1 Tax=Petrolisthes cinctipes TaxID=88211 RepID=A0AAE1GH93_PETCI|nr:hypothetical protein Pcinc_004323 [Petrolisthes cinctipes]